MDFNFTDDQLSLRDMVARWVDKGFSFERRHGMTPWDWFAQHPDEGTIFAGAMVDLTRLDAPAVAMRHVHNALAQHLVAILSPPVPQHTRAHAGHAQGVPL